MQISGNFSGKSIIVMISETIKKWVISTKDRYSRRFFPKIVRLSAGKHPKGDVLVSYITFPFTVTPDHPFFYSHTNLWECRKIANTWLNHGYNVDVIDWDNAWFRPEKEYCVIIDIHANMERIVPYLNKNCKKILHITGAHWQFQNAAEMKRLSDLEKRRGIRLPPERQVTPSRGIEFADCATIMGNDFTSGTFSFANKPLYPIPLSTTVQFPFIRKDFEKIRRNFLWLGSTGMVHKGLDLVLEAFQKMPEYTLSICGPVSKEPDFEKAYYRELYQTHNIRTLGFTDVRSDEFHEVIKNTLALVYPSCSEGGGGSVITGLHAGLIPIISYESSVDVEDFGIILDDCSVDGIISSVRTCSQKTEEELWQMSEKAWHYARANHTREKFAERYEAFVQEITAGTP